MKRPKIRLGFMARAAALGFLIGGAVNTWSSEVGTGFAAAGLLLIGYIIDHDVTP